MRPTKKTCKRKGREGAALLGAPPGQGAGNRRPAGEGVERAMAGTRRRDHAAVRPIARDGKDAEGVEGCEDRAAAETEETGLHDSQQLQANVAPTDAGQGARVAGGRADRIPGRRIRPSP